MGEGVGTADLLLRRLFRAGDFDFDFRFGLLSFKFGDLLLLLLLLLPLLLLLLLALAMASAIRAFGLTLGFFSFLTVAAGDLLRRLAAGFFAFDFALDLAGVLTFFTGLTDRPRPVLVRGMLSVCH